MFCFGKRRQQPKFTGISLGFNCNSAVRGVEWGLRQRRKDGYKTCPFDACVTNLKGVIQCLRDDFKFFTNPAYLQVIQGFQGPEKLIYNSYYKFFFNHESPGHANLYISEKWPGGKEHFINDNFKKFIKRYNERISSFREYIGFRV